MSEKVIDRSLLIKALFALSFFLGFGQQAQAAEISKTTKKLMLGETAVKINVYEKHPAAITFFAPHYNERPGAEATKRIIAEKGGRLVEIESIEANGKPLRNLRFQLQNEFYGIDPNRIFTVNGRKCSKFSPQIETLIVNFASDLLTIILDNHDKTTPIVAVHNNQDSDEKEYGARNQDLTAFAFVKSAAYDAQAQGVYLSNAEKDEDNFIFLSSPAFLSFFAERDFNVVIQKSAPQLFSQNCTIDDGSLSVYFGQKNIPYINLEADIKTGASRQKQMLEAIYLLAENRKNSSQEKK